MFDALSHEQEQLIERLAGLLKVDASPDSSCTPDAAEAALERLYARLGLDTPHVIWCDGPFQLAVMPLLLHLLVFRPTGAQFEKLVKQFGMRKINARETELAAILTHPHWAAALQNLTDQISMESICQLHLTDETVQPWSTVAFERFAWSGCGVSTAEQLCALTKRYTDEAVKSLSRAATLGMATALTSRLYTVPVDRSHRTKQTVNHVLERTEAIRLRDAATVFGVSHGPAIGMYKRASELHTQIGGTIFEAMLQMCPAPQAERCRARATVENDAAVNTAGLMAFGPYETLWGAWASFASTCYSIIAGMFRDQFSRELRTGLNDLSVFLRSGFAYTPLTRVIFICKFPHLVVDEMQRLHCPDGPALEFPDGLRIYALCGVPVPEAIIETPSSLTAKRIQETQNVELRRALIERYGIPKYLQDTWAGIVHRCDAGTLYLKQLPGDEPIAIVQVTNSTPELDGSCKEYFLRVPPHMRSVQEAIAWTFEMSTDEYNPTQQT